MSRTSAQAQREAVRHATANVAPFPTVGERGVNRHLAVQSALQRQPAPPLSTAAVHLAATERALVGTGQPNHHEHVELAGKHCDVVLDDVGVVSVSFE